MNDLRHGPIRRQRMERKGEEKAKAKPQLSNSFAIAKHVRLVLYLILVLNLLRFRKGSVRGKHCRRFSTLSNSIILGPTGSNIIVR